MTAMHPPSERLWYKHPIDRVEGTWIAIALIWCLIMFFMMVGWHIWGDQNLSTETYRTTVELGRRVHGGHRVGPPGQTTARAVTSRRVR